MTSAKTNISGYRYLPDFDDQSDRKALFELQKRLKNVSPRYKQLTMSNYSSGQSSPKEKAFEMPSVHSRNKKSNSVKKGVSSKKKGANDKDCKRNLTKITGWLSKDTKKSKVNQQTEDVENKANKEQITTTSKNSEKTKFPEEKDSKKTFKRNTSGSFAKYGLHIPSFEDIIESQKKYDNHQQYLDKLDEMNYSQESLELNIDEPCGTTVTLNCKHLTNEEIRKAFEQNKGYIYNIFNGSTYSERHERFQKENPKDQFTTKDLKYNTSMLVFTYEQKEELLSYLYKYFDSDSGLGSNNQYFFKVLLPELCLKIFMDVYNMNYDEANEYLEKMPIENRIMYN
ncbi:hypothetical protein ILUMI_01083 [Ignelater luminosus]|uniref:Uncharacterized protein n=1 Tax=Ignelater luminosus TaxID=2038154 RepID=A0A8K0GM18_IGNLU|nr:hypothetical protein ILUMI_01083 [Ignelater luminosus]